MGKRKEPQMRLKIITAAVLAVALTSPAHAGNIMIRGPGLHTCEEVMQAFPDTVQNNGVLEAYADGFFEFHC
jgi:hypothetical protein